MRVTKYPQSCVLLDNGSGRILIDAGTLALDRFAVASFGRVDAVLFTHRHADHLDERALDQWRGIGAAIYGNADVAAAVGDDVVVVADGERFEVAGFDVVALDLEHAELVDGSPGPPNTGFLFDGRLFHPGDGIRLEGLRVETLAPPIAGPSISFRDAYRFVEETGAATVIPLHYEAFVADPQHFAKVCPISRVVVLAHGESVDV